MRFVSGFLISASHGRSCESHSMILAVASWYHERVVATGLPLSICLAC